MFGKGMVIAAPQIGVSRAAAIVRGSDGETVTLLNHPVGRRSSRSASMAAQASAGSTATGRTTVAHIKEGVGTVGTSKQ